MALLKYSQENQDLMFLVYVQNQQATLQKDSNLSLETDKIYDTLDLVIEQLFSLYGEEFNTKKLNEFKRLRKTPTVPKPEFSLLNTLCYIGTVKEILMTGSLKNKDPVDKFTKILNSKGISFDPEFLMLEIRSGLIKSIENAEGLDKLYCEVVQSNKEYFICSGLREVYEKDELLNNTYLFLLNIKKVKFRTLESEGMICCTEGTRVEALKTGVPAGIKIELENQITIFEDLLYGKIDLTKNAFKTILADFKIVDHHLTFRNSKVKINGEYVKTETESGPVR